MVYGRTTEVPSDELRRCERRAQALLGYLAKKGVPASRLEAGYGLVRLGAAVKLEPRVEVQLLP